MGSLQWDGWDASQLPRNWKVLAEALQILMVVDGEDTTPALRGCPRLCFSCHGPFSLFPSSGICTGHTTHATCPCSEMQGWGSQPTSAPAALPRSSLLPPMTPAAHCCCQPATQQHSSFTARWRHQLSRNQLWDFAASDIPEQRPAPAIYSLP